MVIRLTKEAWALVVGHMMGTTFDGEPTVMEKVLFDELSAMREDNDKIKKLLDDINIFLPIRIFNWDCRNSHTKIHKLVSDAQKILKVNNE